MNKRFLTAKEATDLLGITTATLYAYVSRGLIRSEAGESNSRARRYHAEDVTRLQERKVERQNPARIAEAALNWGMPVLDSALTLIADDRLYYRGRDALLLAQTHTFEQVAALLWTGDFERSVALFAEQSGLRGPFATIDMGRVAQSLFQRMMTILVLAAEDDLLAYDLQPDAVARTGARILTLLTSALVGADVTGVSIAARLQAGWCPTLPDAVSLLNAALIVCADHELNASSFTARIAASAETQPYGVVMAGLSTAQGLKHGGSTSRIDALLREVDHVGDAHRVVAERLRRGERIPGFGHRLYQEGDPRAASLLQMIRAQSRDNELRLEDSVVSVVRDTLALEPNIDFALVLLSRLLGLPAGAPLALFTLGRTVGWIAHAIEQYATNDLIRPRARYVGPAPGDDAPL